MSNINVNKQAFQGLQRIDGDKNGKLDLAELQAAADTNGDGKVGLQEAANLENELGRYVDKNLATELAEAAMGSKPVKFSYNLIQAPFFAAEQIQGRLGNTRLQAPMTMYNSPADPPTVLRSAQPGQQININLDAGVQLAKWPPTPVSFTDPETGKPANGTKIEFSTGDVVIVPLGQEVSLSKREEPRQGQFQNGPRPIQIGGKTELYHIDDEGKATNDFMMAKYATVFCTRGL